MTKAEFDRQRQLLWVYLRREGKCAVRGQEVSRDEAATSTAIPVALGIHELLQLPAGGGRMDRKSSGLRPGRGIGAATARCPSLRPQPLQDRGASAPGGYPEKG